MFYNYYEIEKMAQIRQQEALGKANQVQLIKACKSSGNRQGLMGLLTRLKRGFIDGK